MGVAVEVAGLGKRYRIGVGGGYTTLREHLSIRARRSAAAAPSHDMWALRDVSFSLQEGETLGIIGRNGAGKSTLLKILARITEPTTGSARLRGRLASLLEVGTGFHEELTGRENVFLNGVVLGMSRREVQRRFEEIVEFSGIGRYLDMPIKRYSSGMKLRLAFSVAAHLETEIVVVDEVLAVGDSEFQRRCLDKMREMRGSGRTVLFVSHDLGTVAQLCPRSLWLVNGEIADDGPTERVVGRYQASFGSSRIGVDFEQSYGPVRLHRLALAGHDGSALERLRRGDPFAIELAFSIRERVDDLDAAVYVEDSRGVRIVDEALSEADEPRPRLGVPGRYRVRLELTAPLAAREYIAGIWLGAGPRTFFDEPVMRFEVLPALEDPRSAGKRPRILHGGSRWRVTSP